MLCGPHMTTAITAVCGYHNMILQQQIQLNTNNQAGATIGATLDDVQPVAIAGNELQVFTPSTQLVRSVSKNGSQRTALMPRKAWKEANATSLRGLSNRQVKAEYDAYRLNGLEQSTQGLQALVATGAWGAESLVLNKNGDKLRVTLVNKSKVKGLAMADARKTIDNLDPDQLRQLLAELQKAVSAE